MTGLVQKYGKIALALLAIFASGQMIGWMLALNSCEARHDIPSDARAWSEEMLSRLQEDLDLKPEQAEPIRRRLEAVAGRIEEQRDLALFQIHLELLKLHDDLEPDLTPAQQKTLARSRGKLRESIQAKFPQLLRDTALPSEFKAQSPEAPTPPVQ
jgi:hypothetical protein